MNTSGAQRVLFGSDAPWQDPADVLARFLRLPFSDDEREDILHRTAERLFRLPPSEDR
jgi:predicted TIM-barrel fold metal-dependent hydrolase